MVGYLNVTTSSWAYFETLRFSFILEGDLHARGCFCANLMSIIEAQEDSKAYFVFLSIVERLKSQLRYEWIICPSIQSVVSSQLHSICCHSQLACHEHIIHDGIHKFPQ